MLLLKSLDSDIHQVLSDLRKEIFDYLRKCQLNHYNTLRLLKLISKAFRQWIKTVVKICNTQTKKLRFRIYQGYEHCGNAIRADPQDASNTKNIKSVNNNQTQ